MKINFINDPSVAATGMTALYVQAEGNAEAKLESLFPASDPTVINVSVGSGQVGGIPFSGSISVGASANGALWTYQQVVTELTARADTPLAKQAVANLPAQNPFGNKMFFISSSLLKEWGDIAPNATAIDVNIGINPNPIYPWNANAPQIGGVPGALDLSGAISAETTHGMERFPGWGTGDAASIQDLFRYTEKGVIATSGDPAAYYSADGGATVLQPFGVQADGADLSDWSLEPGFGKPAALSDAFGGAVPGNVMNVTKTDLGMLQIFGFKLNNPTNLTNTITPASQVISGDYNDNILVKPEHTGAGGGSIGFINSRNTTVTVAPTVEQETLSIQGGNRLTINDNTNGLSIVDLGKNTLTINDFGKDPTATLTFVADGFRSARQALQGFRPDGHGGIMISNSRVGSVDVTDISRSALRSHIMVAGLG